MSAAIWRNLGLAAAARGDSAVAQVITALADRAAILPGVTVSRDGDAVQLQGHGLVARAFGARRRAADPRLLALTQNLQATGEQP